LPLELVLSGYNRSIFGQRLHDDMAVKGIGVVSRQTEGMLKVIVLSKRRTSFTPSKERIYFFVSTNPGS
jgi:hypothetical protein